MSTQLAQTKKPLVRRIVIIVAAAFAAWHIFATFLWIAPPSGLRQIVPGTILHDYMIPLQGQSWSVFAPEPINGDHRLEVRAIVVPPGGKARTTEWVDASAAELSMLQHDLFPPRGAIQATELASRFKGAYDKLSADQRKVVSLGFYKGDDWRSRMTTKITSYGAGEAATSYLTVDREVNAYATQVAYAVWGDDVVHVQFAVSRQNAIPFAQRNDPDAKRPAVQKAPTGWRGVVEEPGQSRENFGKTFRHALAESGR